MVEKTDIIIPPAYAELLHKLDKKACRDFMKRHAGEKYLQENLFGNKVKIENLVESFVEGFTARSSLVDLSKRIRRSELKMLRRIIRKGGVLLLDGKQKQDDSSVGSLIERGLVFRIKTGNKDAIVAPLEICLGFPFDRNETASSLLLAMNRYSSDAIKLLASSLNIYNYNKYRKVGLSVIVYKMILNNYHRAIESLNELQMDILRMVFLGGSRIPNSLLFD